MLRAGLIRGKAVMCTRAMVVVVVVVPRWSERGVLLSLPLSVHSSDSGRKLWIPAAKQL